MKISFKVESKKTGSHMKQPEAFQLVGFDPRLRMDDFLVDSEGSVAVADTCGNMAYLPHGSYTLKMLIGDSDG